MESSLLRAAEVVLAYGVILALFWAFYDSSRFTAAEYAGMGKIRRRPWLIALGGAIVLDFWLGGFRFSDPLGARSLTWLATALVLAVYLYDLRPKLENQRLSDA